MARDDDDYVGSSRGSDTHHLRRDVRDAYSNAAAAKLLAWLALALSAIALALSVAAWNKANDAWGNAQRAVNSVSARQE